MLCLFRSLPVKSSLSAWPGPRPRGVACRVRTAHRAGLTLPAGWCRHRQVPDALELGASSIESAKVLWVFRVATPVGTALPTTCGLSFQPRSD